MRIPTRVATAVASIAAMATTAVFIPGPATATPEVMSAPSAVTVSEASRTAGEYTSKVRGLTEDGGKVRGTFTPDRFFVKGGDAFARGTLNAVVRAADGTVLGRPSREISIPVKNAQASSARTCDVLNLVLGPLDLNLLGLEVSLNRVVLDIVAVTGSGNLLGNLLCAVAGLLDGAGNLSLLENLRLANLLNRILNLLG